ncbi:MAG: septal ring lytic transglycosylase RlpA family protein [Mongoliibacter sp.]|uniref:septal ring lytic transglycosylase RlpA family protein n=1 Tax=Mongoliibacter sp. TaxID=2022438 RepID=UPI0012F2B9A8|nr:septal ring lytic transglycosylase RlpA family protein [Mongoliibacter sp.]TVP52106.1 MAG: septal ring lytic transglycosylase RlpA family protein [Mongoliibacter sp.]
METPKSIFSAVLLFIIVFFIVVCCRPREEKIEMVEVEGKASYYARWFEGRKTASGEVFENQELTAAHRSLPFDTEVEVINPENGKSVSVRINDRGPYRRGRIIDLSRAAARELGMLDSGIIDVIIRYPKWIKEEEKNN